MLYRGTAVTAYIFFITSSTSYIISYKDFHENVENWPIENHKKDCVFLKDIFFIFCITYYLTYCKHAIVYKNQSVNKETLSLATCRLD